jgi:hypothetical protein
MEGDKARRERETPAEHLGAVEANKSEKNVSSIDTRLSPDLFASTIQSPNPPICG